MDQGRKRGCSVEKGLLYLRVQTLENSFGPDLRALLRHLAQAINKKHGFCFHMARVFSSHTRVVMLERHYR